MTLERVRRKLALCGITRLAEVTRLDSLGVPVYCVIRPAAAVLQVANGKGLTGTAAKVSGLMESIELFHAETPLVTRISRTSVRSLEARGEAFLQPASLAGYSCEVHFSPERRIPWTRGVNLLDGQSTWVPAGVVYFHQEPAVHVTTTNGLASGNRLDEATLHALYELIERDSTERLLGAGAVDVAGRCRIVDLRSIPPGWLRGLVDTVTASGSRLVLLQVESCIEVTTFWAVLLNLRSQVSGSTFNTGWGTHLDPAVAASRAVTEAAQSRATMIHGAREDATVRPVTSSGFAARESKAFGYFGNLEPNCAWCETAGESPLLGGTGEVAGVLARLVSRLGETGHEHIVRCDLTRPDIDVAVSRVVAPKLRFRHR